MKHNILALDIAKRTGFAYNNGKEITSGYFDALQRKGRNRTDVFYEFFINIVRTKNITEIAIEEVTFVSNRYAYRSFVMFENEINKMSTLLNIPIFRYNVRTVKKCFTGRGSANKQMMMNVASEKCSKKIVDDNEADAIGVLYTHIKKQNL
jgi:Holliday junction resolvasome RuvABC endonuclease subunit